MMRHVPRESLAAILETLSDEEQASVLRFIEYLKTRTPKPGTAFLQAADEFIEQHPELLRRLAQ